MKRKMEGHGEEGETAQMEARAHSPGFLKKAARMAVHKKGRGKMRKIKTGRY